MMHPYIEALKAYITADPPRHPNEESLLEMLYCRYMEFTAADSGEIRDGFRQVEAYANDLPGRQANELLAAVSALCWAHEQRGFTEGVRIGAALMMELNA